MGLRNLTVYTDDLPHYNYQYQGYSPYEQPHLYSSGSQPMVYDPSHYSTSSSGSGSGFPTPSSYGSSPTEHHQYHSQQYGTTVLSGTSTSSYTTTPHQSTSSRKSDKKSSSSAKTSKAYVCVVAQCGASFTRSADLDRHLRTVHFPEKIDCQHKWCGRYGDNGFSRKDHLNDHLRDMHRENIPKVKKGRSPR